MKTTTSLSSSMHLVSDEIDAFKYRHQSTQISCVEPLDLDIFHRLSMTAEGTGETPDSHTIVCRRHQTLFLLTLAHLLHRLPELAERILEPWRQTKT
jgi:hypothetical protein